MSGYNEHFNPERAPDFENRPEDCEAFLNFAQKARGNITALLAALNVHQKSIDDLETLHDPGCPSVTGRWLEAITR